MNPFVNWFEIPILGCIWRSLILIVDVQSFSQETWCYLEKALAWHSLRICPAHSPHISQVVSNCILSLLLTLEMYFSGISYTSFRWFPEKRFVSRKHLPCFCFSFLQFTKRIILFLNDLDHLTWNAEISSSSFQTDSSLIVTNFSTCKILQFLVNNKQIQ